MKKAKPLRTNGGVVSAHETLLTDALGYVEVRNSAITRRARIPKVANVLLPVS